MKFSIYFIGIVLLTIHLSAISQTYYYPKYSAEGEQDYHYTLAFTGSEVRLDSRVGCEQFWGTFTIEKQGSTRYANVHINKYQNAACDGVEEVDVYAKFQQVSKALFYEGVAYKYYLVSWDKRSTSSWLPTTLAEAKKQYPEFVTSNYYDNEELMAQSNRMRSRSSSSSSSSRSSNLADRVIDKTMDYYTPDADENAREMTRNAIKAAYDPRASKTEEYWKNAEAAAKRSMNDDYSAPSSSSSSSSSSSRSSSGSKYSSTNSSGQLIRTTNGNYITVDDIIGYWKENNSFNEIRLVDGRLAMRWVQTTQGYTHSEFGPWKYPELTGNTLTFEAFRNVQNQIWQKVLTITSPTTIKGKNNNLSYNYSRDVEYHKIDKSKVEPYL